MLKTLVHQKLLPAAVLLLATQLSPLANPMATLFAPPAAKPAFTLETGYEYTDDIAPNGEDVYTDLKTFAALYTVPLTNAELTYAATYEHRYFSRALQLPVTGDTLAQQWHHPAFSIGYRYFISREKMAGAVVSAESPSDKPFNSYDELSIQMNAFYRMPARQRDAWLFLLNYSSTRGFLNHVPLPGVAYWYQPSRKTMAMIGFPVFYLKHEFNDSLDVNLRSIMIYNAQVELGWRINRQWRLYSAWTMDTESYFPAGRADDDDQVHYDYTAVKAGLEGGIGRRLKWNAFVGQVIDHRIYLGEDNDDDEDAFDLDEALIYAISVNLRF